MMHFSQYTMIHNGTRKIISQLDWLELLITVAFMKAWSKEMKIMNNSMKNVDLVVTSKTMVTGITLDLTLTASFMDLVKR